MITNHSVTDSGFAFSRALSSRSVDGMFLMRTSKHAGTDLVITVWNDGECKHYKLFQDKVCFGSDVHKVMDYLFQLSLL